MKLIIFDCDDTIWKIPYKEEDKYMDLPESIINHDFKYNKEIIDIYEHMKKEPNVRFAILTNRTFCVKDIILERLKSEKGLEFDYTMFRVDNRDKSERLYNLIHLINNVDYIEFYDDKDKHIKSINTLKNKFPKITIKTIKV